MFELSLLAPQDRVEQVTDALIDELGALSVSVEDADAGSAAEVALFGEPGMALPGSHPAGWNRSTLKALFADEPGATRAAAWLLAQEGETVHSVAGGALVICLERELTLELIRAIAEGKPERVVCLDEGFAGNDQLKANAVQTFKTKGIVKFQTV